MESGEPETAVRTPLNGLILKRASRPPKTKAYFPEGLIAISRASTPAANGEPTISINAPVAGAILKAEMLSEPSFTA